MNRLVLPGLGVLVLAIAAGCSGGGSGAASGDYSLSSGDYNYNATSAPTNTCWGAAKGVPALPMAVDATITMNGNVADVTLHITTSISAAISMTKTGNDLSGTNAADIDLNPNIDCVLHVDSTITGSMTGNDAFDATQPMHISEKSGSACGLLIGSLSNYQFDALPCDLTLAGNVTKK